MYPQEIVQPMRDELTAVGFKQINEVEQIEAEINATGTTLVVVNSICGCAAANARPGVRFSLDNEKVPSNLVTVFAGVDREATDAARALMVPFPPSSPSMALFKDGELVHMLERHHIEGRNADIIAENLRAAYNEHC
ncbi:MAG: BrxA/BrxB family bacilliredoxin [Flavobacteriaceae bacterium]